ALGAALELAVELEHRRRKVGELRGKDVAAVERGERVRRRELAADVEELLEVSDRPPLRVLAAEGGEAPLPVELGNVVRALRGLGEREEARREVVSAVDEPAVDT